jgi:hypothetical protein
VLRCKLRPTLTAGTAPAHIGTSAAADSLRLVTRCLQECFQRALLCPTVTAGTAVLSPALVHVPTCFCCLPMCTPPPSCPTPTAGAALLTPALVHPVTCFCMRRYACRSSPNTHSSKTSGTAWLAPALADSADLHLLVTWSLQERATTVHSSMIAGTAPAHTSALAPAGSHLLVTPVHLLMWCCW